MARKKNPEANLNRDTWKSGWKKHKVNSEEVMAEVSRQAGEPGLYLFDGQDEDLVKTDSDWKPFSKDSFGVWDQ